MSKPSSKPSKQLYTNLHVKLDTKKSCVVLPKGSYIENLIDIQPLIDIVSLTLQTAFVKDNVDGYRPSNLLLIAKPESAKTKTIEKFQPLPFVYYTDEITVKILVDRVLKRIESKEIRFILIPDILNSIKKQFSTREPLIQTFKTLTDEGTTRIETFHKEYITKTKCKAGLISAITRSELYASQGRYSIYSDLQRYGFLSRMIPFSYEYPIDKLDKVFSYVMSGDAEGEGVVIPKIRQFKKEKLYQPKIEHFHRLRGISEKLSSYSDSYGIRVQKSLQKLCYANALMDNRNYVAKEDVDKVLYLGRWMNFEFNPL